MMEMLRDGDKGRYRTLYCYGGANFFTHGLKGTILLAIEGSVSSSFSFGFQAFGLGLRLG